MRSYLKKAPQPSSPPPQVALGDAGVWHYEGTDIPAVGARPVSLSEATDPRLVIRADAAPEAVLLSLSEIEANPNLLWALPAGTRLDGDKEPLYKVPWELWQEHESEPVGAWLPERDATGLDRALAGAERDYRFAKQALDEAGAARQSLVLLAARLGRSRRGVGETLGLSAARIQQLNESPPEGIADFVEQLVDSATRVAALVGNGACPRDELPRPRDLGADELDEIVEAMLAAGLMEDAEQGLTLTKDGRALLGAKDDKPKPVRSDRDRERAGDATR